jgi:GNAT superfamily N-acetyltransferase
MMGMHNRANQETNFAAALTQAYLSAPGEVLPNALWKTLVRLEDCETTYHLQPDGQTSHLEIWQERRLLLHWDAARVWNNNIPPQRLQQLDFALLHEQFLPRLDAFGFQRRKAYFRLSFRGLPQRPRLPAGFGFTTVQIHEEAGLAAEVIRRCYAEIHPSVENVRSWTLHPVYDRNLWIWVWDENRSAPAGLGIAELDSSIGEGSLEWIQVLPEYRGLGLGQALVLELLQRMQRQSDFVTVAGEVDNRTRPEQLYRRCGFDGEDIWWLLQK